MLPTIENTLMSLFPEWPVMDSKERRVVVHRCLKSVKSHLKKSPTHIKLGLNILFFCYQLYTVVFYGWRLSYKDLYKSLMGFSSLPITSFGSLEVIDELVWG